MIFIKTKTKYDWASLYQEFVESDLSKTAFIKRKRLPTTAYAKLDEMKIEFEKAKDEDSSKEIETVSETACADSDTAMFIPVSVIPDDTITVAETIMEIPPIILNKNGFQLSIPKGFDLETLSRILEAIHSCCV